MPVDWCVEVLEAQRTVEQLCRKYRSVPQLPADEFVPVQLPGWRAGWSRDVVAMVAHAEAECDPSAA